MITEAKNLKVGDRYKSNTSSSIMEVVEIINVSDKAITFKIDRIFPETSFVKGWEQRKRLNTKLEVIN